MKNQYLGFDKEQKLIIPVRGMISIEENYETVKAAFSQHSSITGAAVSSKVIGQRLDRWDTELVGEGEDEGRVLNHMYTGPDFLNVYKIDLIAGRNFSLEQGTDAKGTFILNRTAAAEYGWSPEDALGKRLESIVAGEVIGVVEDFHYMGLQVSIEPLAIFWGPDYFGTITLNVSTENLTEALAFAENKWEELFLGILLIIFFWTPILTGIIRQRKG